MPDPSPPPRIGFNALLLSVDSGFRAAGIHRYIVSLLEALADIEDIAVTAFVPRSWPSEVLPEAIELWRAPAATTRPLTRVLWEQAALPSALANTGVDLFHGAAYALPTAARCPSVVTVHDLSPFRYAASLPRWKAFYLRAATRHAAKRADALVAVSQFTAAELTEVLDVPAERVHVVANGVDDRFGRASDDEAASFRSRVGLPQEYVLTLGTLQPRKNLSTLLEAYASLRSSRDDVPDLVVVGGDGWGGVDVDTMAEQLGISGLVHVLGYVEDDDLPSLYAGALVFAYPSRYEGFGLPVLEAMACGVPTVVATGSSLTEVTGDDTVAVKPDDAGAWAEAIRALLDDEDRRAALSQAGRSRAASLTWSAAAADTLDVYRHVLGRQAAGRASGGAASGGTANGGATSGGTANGGATSGGTASK